MNHLPMTGAELQCLREACGLDRDQFGELCGVQGRTVKYWETGKALMGVPADVAALVLKIEAEVIEATSQALATFNGAESVVLRRGSDPVENEVTNRVYTALRRRGQDVRMVAFNYPDYCEWLGGDKDHPERRNEWARHAVKDQARTRKAA